MEQKTEAVLQGAVDAMLQEGRDISIAIIKPTISERIRKIKERKFTIYPSTLGTMLRISRLLLDLELEEISEDDPDHRLLEAGLLAVVNNMDKAVKIIAYAISNDIKEPPAELVRFLERNLTAKDTFQILQIVIDKMDIKDFFAFTASVKGMNLMAGRSTTGKQSEELSNTSDSEEMKSSGDGPGKTS